MNSVKFIILFSLVIIFFGNIKAENSITLTYNNGETETFLFTEDAIRTSYDNNVLRNILNWKLKQ